jgi:hypothetical protein
MSMLVRGFVRLVARGAGECATTNGRAAGGATSPSHMRTCRLVDAGCGYRVSLSGVSRPTIIPSREWSIFWCLCPSQLERLRGCCAARRARGSRAGRQISPAAARGMQADPRRRTQAAHSSLVPIPVPNPFLPPLRRPRLCLCAVVVAAVVRSGLLPPVVPVGRCGPAAVRRVVVGGGARVGRGWGRGGGRVVRGGPLRQHKAETGQEDEQAQAEEAEEEDGTPRGKERVAEVGGGDCARHTFPNASPVFPPLSITRVPLSSPLRPELQGDVKPRLRGVVCDELDEGHDAGVAAKGTGGRGKGEML